MQRARIKVNGAADRLLRDGLEDLRPIFGELGDGLLIIGGLMARVWLHVHPIEIPARATSDVDIGVDRRTLRIVGDRKVISPLLNEAGFEQRSGDEEFRFQKSIGGSDFFVDLGVAPGSSREDPPQLESGISSIAVPGLAFAFQRRTVIEVEFDDGAEAATYELPLPTLDAAFVLKGALVARGVRMRPDRRRRDTVDSIFLAAAATGSRESMRSLDLNKRRSDVREAVEWLRREFVSPRTAAARRVGVHFEEEGIPSSGEEWAVEIARRFLLRLDAEARSD